MSLARRTSVFVLALSLPACAPPANELRMPLPGQIRRALSMLTDLQASAAVVPRGGTPGAPISLTRGDDGMSFSGFVAAEPGEYTIEVALSGDFEGYPPRAFLGRMVSDSITVIAGSTADAVFSRPLDTIGRPEDHGDDDGDGLGLFDELLWDTDPAMADSDADGLRDGLDCDPADGARNFSIVSGGSIDDCDGDGVQRPDIPFRTGGMDCDDRAPAVHPGAEDRCDDGVDTDCNPATCPLDDQRGPEITGVSPRDGEVVGCHRVIEAMIRDSSGVAAAEVQRFDDTASSTPIERVALTNISGELYRTGTLDRATAVWLDNGPERFVVSARDTRGNTASVAVTLMMQLEVPAASMSPAVVGRMQTRFDLSVTASAAQGLSSIRLMRAPLSGGGVDRSGEVEVGSAATSPAVFSIDPAMLADGDYAFYPLVVDRIGNRLQPNDSFTPDTLPGGELVAEPDYLCVNDPGPARVPVRVLSVGQTSVPQPAKMKDHLAEAIAAAAARDPNAVPVEIRGWGVESDGRIRLDQPVDGRWWRYVYFNFTDDRLIEVTWFSAAYSSTNPVVEVTEDSPFGFSYHPFINLPGLVDSDQAASAYGMAAGCSPLTGDMSESIRWLSDEPFSTRDVLRVDVGADAWKATATAPITEISGCM